MSLQNVKAEIKDLKFEEMMEFAASILAEWIERDDDAIGRSGMAIAITRACSAPTTLPEVADGSPKRR